MVEVMDAPAVRMDAPAGRQAVRIAVPRAPGRLGRNDWLVRCTARLLALRPDDGAESIGSLADELWRAAPHFHPETAAELEHESCRSAH